MELVRVALPWLGLKLAVLVALLPLSASANPFGLRPLRAGPATVAQPRSPVPDEETKVATEAEADADAPRPAKLLKRRNVPPFWVDREFDTHRTRALTFPPVFVHRTPKKDQPERLFHFDLSLTLGWYGKKAKKTRYLAPAGLFFGSFSKRKTAWGSGVLLMGYKRLGEKFNFGQFPLFWWWGNKHVKNFLAIPFHYQQKAPDGFRGVSGLLFWYGHKKIEDADPDNDRRHFVAAPVFWRFQRGLRRYDISPLYVGGYNKLKGLRHHAVIPFYLWQSHEFDNRRELWSLFWIRRKDRARGKSAWALPALLTFSHDSPDRKILGVTPLLWRARNKLKGSRTTVVGPVGVYRDPRQRNNFFAPLWWQFSDLRHKTTTSMLVPLVVTRRTPERTSVWTPIAGGMRSRRGGWGFAVEPLLTFVGRRDDDLRYQGVLGAFWHVRNPRAHGGKGSDHVVLGPLLYRARRGQRVDFGVPPLLSFAGKRGTRRYQVITPLFWHARDRDPDNPLHTVVLGPAYYHRKAGMRHGGLPPLVFAGRGDKGGYAALPLLLSWHRSEAKTRSQTTVTPLFVRSKRPGYRTLGVLGLGWDVKRPSERHSVFFPLYYRRHLKGRTLTLTPLGGGLRERDRRIWVAGPVVGSRSAKTRGFGVIPVFLNHTRTRDEGVDRHTALVPLYLRRRTPEEDLDMWSPLVWRSHVRGKKPRHGLSVVPFYFRQRQPGGVDVDAGFAWFYSRDARRRTHTIVGGPAFHRLSRKRLNTGIAPLYWWMDAEDKRRLLALPAIFHFENKGDNSHTTVAVPFWFDRLRPNGRRTWGAFPFVFSTKRLNNFTRFSVAPPGYFDIFRLRKNYRFTGFVPLAFRYQKCGFREEDDASCQYQLWGSFPFVLVGKDGKGRRTHAALLAYYWDRGPDGTKLYTPIAGVNYKKSERLGWYLFPLYVKTTQTHRRVFLVPLYFRKAHRLKDESTTVIVPPLYVGRHQQDRRWFQTALMVWQFRAPHKVSTAVVPPVFFHSHAWAERRLTWVLPLFVRDSYWGKDKTWTSIFPAAYFQRRKGENLDFVQFPLVWHIERGQNQGTFGAFVWWDIRVRDTITQLVPAVFTRRVSRLHDTKVIGPFLAWWSRGKGVDSDRRMWRVLFGVFGGESNEKTGERWFVLFGRRIKLKSKGSSRDAKPKAKTKRSAKRRERRKARRDSRNQAIGARL